MTGIILLNKPRGLSSNSAANIVKKAVGAKKAGHLGTLDVEAQGLLPITINSSTKLFDCFLHKDKQYKTIFKFGEETDTFDLEGETTKVEDVDIDTQQLASALKAFEGKIKQLPPDYSAKKINGKKAYQLKREGKEVSLQPKEVEIYKFELIDKIDKNTFQFLIECSSGTYIRALCRDLAITRTKCGNFDLKDAFSLQDVKEGKYALIKPETLFDYQPLNLSSIQQQKILNGDFIKTDQADGTYKVFGESFLGIGRVEDGILKLKLRLN